MGLRPAPAVQPGTDCWIWTRGVTKNGYGSWRNEYVHRMVYAAQHGPIPAGHIVHHRCEVKRCFRPDHLVAIPRAQHQRHHTKAACAQGHPYPESQRRGRSDCAVCHRADARQRRRKRKQPSS